MCLVALALHAVPDAPVVVVANRDESTAREATPLRRWPEGFLAGRDTAGGGTWMGAAPGGRWAIVTNVRDPEAVANARAGRRAERSRGDLPVNFLTSDASPASYVADALGDADRYDPFNLLVGVGADVWFVSSRESAPRPLAAGVFGLSNATLDTPWPKTVRLRDGLRARLSGGVPPAGALLDLLDDTTQAGDAELPDTGVGIDAERMLSAPRIVAPGYGTRVSTVFTLAGDGRATLVERTWSPDGSVAGQVRLTL